MSITQTDPLEYGNLIVFIFYLVKSGSPKSSADGHISKTGFLDKSA